MAKTVVGNVTHIPFEELKGCPDCGHTKLRKVHDRKYPSQKGIDRLVIYRCPNGHETPRRQTVATADDLPPKELWENDD